MIRTMMMMMIVMIVTTTKHNEQIHKRWKCRRIWFTRIFLHMRWDPPGRGQGSPGNSRWRNTENHEEKTQKTGFHHLCLKNREQRELWKDHDDHPSSSSPLVIIIIIIKSDTFHHHNIINITYEWCRRHCTGRFGSHQNPRRSALGVIVVIEKKVPS